MNSALKLLEKVVLWFSEIAVGLLGAAAAYLLFVIYREEGFAGVIATIRGDIASLFIRYIPVLLVFFAITGALNHLQARHAEDFRKIISGKNGRLSMIILAASLPGPAGGKQIQDGWNDGSIDKTNVLLCLFVMMAMGVNTLLFRAKVLGGPLTLIWLAMASCFLVQVWLVCLAKPWTWVK
jgi:hypothetical protein